MQSIFEAEIAKALGPEAEPEIGPEPEAGPATRPALRHVDPAGMSAAFDVAGLALASVGAAARELAALTGAGWAELSARRTLLWFGMTLRPEGWALPAAWDPVAGDYRTADGWLRLHTNAPHHRAAALAVLGCAPEPAAVARAVAGWQAGALEAAVVAAGGAAAEMRSLADWAAHPQGRAVAAAPLIDWAPGSAGPRRRLGRSLAGLRVLDLTRVLAGPAATRLLAGFGAEVLRIDPPGWSEPALAPEMTLGKRRAGLDLTQAPDRARFEALLARADVLVHGYRPGALAGLGYGQARRAALAPGLIDVSLSAYGRGPWEGRRGFDSLVQMSAGIAAAGQALAGAEAGAEAGATRPVPLPVQALDHATGYLLAAAVLRALRRRALDGRGARARLSLAGTAWLLTRAGPCPTEGTATERPEDVAPGTEVTAWGPGRRLRFPFGLEGAEARWPWPAGPLRQHPPAWAA